MKKFENRVAVITGAGGGIGREISVGLARKGCHLVLVDKNGIGLSETEFLVKEVCITNNFYHSMVSSHIVDVSDRTAMEDFVHETISLHGHINILVNNAGITLNKTVEEHTLRDFELVIGVNLWGVIHGCQLFLPYLKSQDEAHIVNMSSMVGFMGVPTQPSYSLTKAAVKGFSESLWAELKGSSVNLTCVYPGAVRTNIIRASSALASNQDFTNKMADRIDLFAMKPEKAAEKIIHAVERNKMRVLVGADAYIVEFIKRLFPNLIHRILGFGFKLKDKLQSSNAPGSSTAIN